VILNSRVSACAEERVLRMVELMRSADVCFAQLELPLHDFDDKHTFPAAEGALSWMSAPTWVADELRWCGIDIVSTASNHALDFSYGGLFSTLQALDERGLSHAGSGPDLGTARVPAFVDCSAARVAVVAATSAFPSFARAGAAREDMVGRPGVNALRHLHVVDPRTADEIISVSARLGLWVVRLGDEFAVAPAGMFNSLRRFAVAGSCEHPTTMCDEDDLAANLSQIRYAADVADFVVAHLHVHDWDAHDGHLSSTPAYVHQYAREAVRAGAGVVIAQGSHAPIRGIDIVDGVPVILDPGPLFRLGRRDRQPQDFYTRWGGGAAARAVGAGPLDAFAGRDAYFAGPPESPRDRFSHRPGAVLPVLQIDRTTHRVTAIDLHPYLWLTSPRAHVGFPAGLDGEDAELVISAISALSAEFGTTISRTGPEATIHLP
jgi:hypothetical protein